MKPLKIGRRAQSLASFARTAAGNAALCESAASMALDAVDSNLLGARAWLANRDLLRARQCVANARRWLGSAERLIARHSKIQNRNSKISK